MAPSGKKTGLVLGSGSSRGWAHIGVIEALIEENIDIDYISGCSIGAYVGAIHASGSLENLKNFVLEMDGEKVFSYFDVIFPKTGFLNGTKKVKELFSMHTDAKNFSDLNIPLRMVATDLETGDKVVFNSGSLINSLRASMSIPGLFAPARYKKRWLVDGGLVDPVPISVARAMGADIVIAVNLNSGLISQRQDKQTVKIEKNIEHSHPSFFPGSHILRNKLNEKYSTYGANLKDKITSMFNIEPGTPHIMDSVSSSIAIMQERITRINLAVDPPDILIEPRLGDLKMMDFDQVDHAINEGYIKMKEKIDDLKTLLDYD